MCDSWAGLSVLQPHSLWAGGFSGGDNYLKMRTSCSSDKLRMSLSLMSPLHAGLGVLQLSRNEKQFQAQPWWRACTIRASCCWSVIEFTTKLNFFFSTQFFTQVTWSKSLLVSPGLKSLLWLAQGCVSCSNKLSVRDEWAGLPGNVNSLRK